MCHLIRGLSIIATDGIILQLKTNILPSPAFLDILSHVTLPQHGVSLWGWATDYKL